MDKIDSSSLDITKANIEKIKELFPNVVTEGKIDFDVLRNILGAEVDDSKEKYQFTWKGKSAAIKLAQSPSTATLRPSKQDSKGWDTTENLYIEGDNLEVLKQLQKTYYGKVKMIYIDPPYNTGNDFVYKDDFKDSIKNYKEQTKQAMASNPDTNGRYHTDWLNMMYPRLLLAKNLISDNGVIFISIDDNELNNLKKVCDEIFGEQNYINTISLKLKNIAGASGGGEDKRLKKNMEFILLYSKNYNSINKFNNVYSYTPIAELVEQYRKNGISWKYTSVLINRGRKVYIGSTIDGDGEEIKIFKRINYEIKAINTIIKDEGISEREAYEKYSNLIFQTAMPQSSIRPRIMKKVEEIGDKSDLYSIEYIPKTGRNKGQMYEQFYKGDNFRLFAWLKDVVEEKNGILCKKDLQGTLWDFVGETKNLTKEGGVPFPNGKKPVKLIKQMLSMVTGENDIILDFFSGSASTAHGIISQNIEDCGNRKYILIQLPEHCSESSEAYKEGYKNICEVGKNRIRRAGDILKEEWIKVNSSEGLFAEEQKEFPYDIGFKVFKLDSTNFLPWDNELEMDEETLFEHSSEVFKQDRSKEDVLYEILLKYGVFDMNVSEIDINGKKMYQVGKRYMLVCLENEVSSDDIKAIAEQSPKTVVFKESGFQNDNDKINAIYNLEKAGVEDIKCI